jgi:hypothetical protein
MKKHNFIFILFIAAALMSQTGGCITAKMYPGPERPLKEIAVLKYNPDLFVSKVDGIATSRFWHTVDIHVLPGKHTVEVAYHASSSYWLGGQVTTSYWSVTNKSVTFDAMPRHTYSIDPGADLIAMTWKPEIIDLGIDYRDIVRYPYNARTDNMVPSDYDLAKRYPYAVAVEESTGGGGPGSSLMSLIWDKDFTAALRYSMEKSHLFQVVTDSKAADYILYVTIVKYDKPILGADLDIKTKMKWELKQTKTSQTVWSETIETTHKTKFWEASNPAIREQIATEGSARANIREGIHRLSMASL